MANTSAEVVSCFIFKIISLLRHILGKRFKNMARIIVISYVFIYSVYFK